MAAPCDNTGLVILLLLLKLTAAAMTNPEYILTLSCLDQRGIVHRVSGFLAEHDCNIIDSAQFGDQE